MDGAMDRRGFLGLLGRAAAAGAALGGVPWLAGCDLGDGADGGTLHGPIRAAERQLMLDFEESARGLFAPYQDGEPLGGGWAVAHLARGERQQLWVVVVDLETGGHAELELYRRAEAAPAPLAVTAQHSLYLNNGAHGDEPTPVHLGKLAEDLAAVIGRNEAGVALAWTLPGFLDLPAQALTGSSNTP